jgi:hypothetical protein
VSCSSDVACIAVASYLNGSSADVTLAEAWNGVRWTIEPTPDPSGAFVNVLNGVSCASAKACTAVGYHSSLGFSGEPLAEAWNGKTWIVEATPGAAIGRFVDTTLNAVSCSTPLACTAVGSYYDSSGIQRTLAERWNGKVWVTETTSNPLRSFGDVLDGVSCTSARSCTAIGSYDDRSDDGKTLAERWNGSRWTIEPTPNPASAPQTILTLSGVSCASARACMAVGSYWIYAPGYGTMRANGRRHPRCGPAYKQVWLVERWDGLRWSIDAPPIPAAASSLSSVSCTSSGACTAVGGNYAERSGRRVLLIERWNGTSWTNQTAPIPGTAEYGGLNGVSCTSARACTAVGWAPKPLGPQSTLAEAWNGKTWSVRATPNPPGYLSPSLSGVSCTSATTCTAVGSSSTPGTVTLAEKEHG